MGSFDYLEYNFIDCLYIAVPNHMHVAVAVRALRQGVSVLIEKPIAANYDDAAALEDAVAESDGWALEAVWSMYSPAFSVLQELVELSDSGVRLSCTLGVGMSESDSRSSYFWSEKYGGGITRDMGVYAISLARMVLGRPVNSRSSVEFDGSVDSRLLAEVHFERGSLTLFATGYERIISGARADVPDFGEGSIIGPLFGPRGIVLVPTGESPLAFRVPPGNARTRFLVDQVVASIRAREHPPEVYPLSYSLDVVSVCDALRNGSE